MFIKGLIGNVLVTLATVYAPNDGQDTFIHNTLTILTDFGERHLILGRDFNATLNPTVDTSSGVSSLRTSKHKRITRVLHEAQLIYIWRLHHAGERDYMFFSSPHKVYSRIDYFLVPHSQLEAAQAPETGNITWSDHAPITMRYTLSQTSTTKAKFWRLNESLLQTPSVLTDITKELNQYF